MIKIFCFPHCKALLPLLIILSVIIKEEKKEYTCFFSRLLLSHFFCCFFFFFFYVDVGQTFKRLHYLHNLSKEHFRFLCERSSLSSQNSCYPILKKKKKRKCWLKYYTSEGCSASSLSKTKSNVSNDQESCIARFSLFSQKSLSLKFFRGFSFS